MVGTESGCGCAAIVSARSGFELVQRQVESSRSIQHRPSLVPLPTAGPGPGHAAGLQSAQDRGLRISDSSLLSSLVGFSCSDANKQRSTPSDQNHLTLEALDSPKQAPPRHLSPIDSPTARAPRVVIGRQDV
jgi:hypothetical protein